MSERWARILVTGYFLLFAAAVTWPGLTLFNHTRPLVLGLPFVMAWITAWVVMSGVVLFAFEMFQRRRAAPTQPDHTRQREV